MLALKRKLGVGPTAVVAHGANPGLVSHFLKEAAITILQSQSIAAVDIPQNRTEWAETFCMLGVKAVHIAEYDSQMTERKKRVSEFVNTWSEDGFAAEAAQPAELGWGTHEKYFPTKGRQHSFGCKSAIYLEQPGGQTLVKSWTPLSGSYLGYLITHNESISISDYLSMFSKNTVVYRPTVLYAYRPCNDAILSLGELKNSGWCMPTNKRLLQDDIISGVDELGVLLLGNQHKPFWYGSRLSINEARSLVPFNTATSLQVASGILGGIVWAVENPYQGVVEAEEMDHAMVLKVAKPYLGQVVGEYGNWNPLDTALVPHDKVLDRADPWQFVNLLV